MSLTKLEPEQRAVVIDRARDGRGRIHCAACRRVVHKGGFEIDHIVPEIESTPEMRSDLRNLQILCKLKDGNGCHARKTRKEAKRYARLNRPSRNWALIRWSAFGALATGAYGVQGLGELPEYVTGERIAYGLGGVLAGYFCTKIVQNAFGTARPLENNRPAPVPEPEIVPVERIEASVRELVGAKGSVKVIDVTDRPRAFTLTYAGTGFPARDTDKRLDLVLQVSTAIGGRWEADWDTTRDRVRLTERPVQPPLIHHPGLAPERPWYLLPVAPGVSFNLLDTSHILIAGETNSGKTAMLRSIIVAALDSARRDDSVRVILVDPKQIEFLGFRGWAGVHRIVRKPADLWDIAFAVEKEMKRRFDALADDQVPLSSHPKWIVIFDEFEQYKIQVERYWLTEQGDDGKPLKKTGQRMCPPLVAIASVLAMARRAGIHLVISTQSPDADVFGKSAIRQNMPGRATVGAIDEFRARMMFNDSSVGRDVPSKSKGLATFQIGDGKPTESQTFWLSDPADADPNYTNTQEDWANLVRLGMPKELMPV